MNWKLTADISDLVASEERFRNRCMLKYDLFCGRRDLPMHQRSYGRSGIQVSALAYGAMTIGQDPDLSGGVAPSLLRALEAGVTLVDTARLYPGSEEIVAETLRAWRGSRPVVSTKLAPLSFETFRTPAPLASAYTPESIRQSVDASLRALKVARLDIVHLHQWHYAWTHELAWLEALTRLRAEGKVGAIAVSAQDHEHDALLEAVSGGLVDGVQLILNLFESRPLASILPLCAARGVGVIARCALDSGGLTGMLGREAFAARRFLRDAPFAMYQARLQELQRAFTPEPAADLVELALRVCLSAGGVSAISLGMPEVRQVNLAISACDQGPLTMDTVAKIRREHVWTKNFYERLT